MHAGECKWWWHEALSLYETINYVVDFEASYAAATAAAVVLWTSRDNDVAAAADHDDELIFDLLSDRIFDLITRILKNIQTFVLQTYIRLYLCTDTSFFSAVILTSMKLSII